MLDHLEQSLTPRSPSHGPAFSATRRPQNVDTAPAETAAPHSAEAPLVRKVCIVEFRSGEAVVRHPDLKCYLDDGWLIESAVPQLSDAQRVDLLVVLSKCEKQEFVPVEEDDR